MILKILRILRLKYEKIGLPTTKINISATKVNLSYQLSPFSTEHVEQPKYILYFIFYSKFAAITDLAYFPHKLNG